MRNIFVDELSAIARENPNVVLLMSECGFSVTEKFEEEFPTRFYNTGIAEQSLVGTAAGMALRGMRPVAYNMAMFLTMRAYEQIRDDIAYQNVPVVLAGVGPGIGYGSSGTTHHTIEDVAIMRVLPNMTVVFPSCETDVRAVTRQAFLMNSPVYIGLARAPRQFDIPYAAKDVTIGKAIKMTEGTDVALFSNGPMLPTATAATERLKAEGIAVSLYNMHTIKPIDTDAIDRAVSECGAVMSLEEASIIGGLGGAMAEYLAENHRCKFKRLGINDRYPERMGDYQWLLQQFGLDVDGVVQSVKDFLRR